MSSNLVPVGLSSDNLELENKYSTALKKNNSAGYIALALCRNL